MTMVKRLRYLGVLLTALVVAMSARAEEAAKPPKTYLVAIGVGKYKDDQIKQRPFAFTENDQVERAELEHKLRTKCCLHTARNNQCFRPHPPHDVRKFQIESQRHPRGRDTDDVP